MKISLYFEVLLGQENVELGLGITESIYPGPIPGQWMGYVEWLDDEQRQYSSFPPLTHMVLSEERRKRTERNDRVK